MHINQSPQFKVTWDTLELDNQLEHLWNEKEHRNLRNSVLVYFIYQTTFTNNENEVWLYEVDVFDRASCMWLDGHISTRCLKFDILHPRMHWLFYSLKNILQKTLLGYVLKQYSTKNKTNRRFIYRSGQNHITPYIFFNNCVQINPMIKKVVETLTFLQSRNMSLTFN